MPPSLLVVTLKPAHNDQDQLELEMKVAGESRAAVVDLVHRMEGSNHFQGPQLVSETGDQGGSGSGNGISAVINAIYVPETIRSKR